MWSLCVKFHDCMCKGKAIMCQLPFSVINAVTLTFDLLTSKLTGHIFNTWGVCVWSFMMIGVKEKQLELNLSGNPTGRPSSFPELKCLECVHIEMICEMSWRMFANKISFIFKRDQSWFLLWGLLLCDQVPLNRGINDVVLLNLSLYLYDAKHSTDKPQVWNIDDEFKKLTILPLFDIDLSTINIHVIKYTWDLTYWIYFLNYFLQILNALAHWFKILQSIFAKKTLYVGLDWTVL